MDEQIFVKWIRQGKEDPVGVGVTACAKAKGQEQGWLLHLAMQTQEEWIFIILIKLLRKAKICSRNESTERRAFFASEVIIVLLPIIISMVTANVYQSACKL